MVNLLAQQLSFLSTAYFIFKPIELRISSNIGVVHADPFARATANGYGKRIDDNVASYYLSTDRLADLNSLRDFRSNILMQNASGRAFVKSYYRYVPTAAGWIKDSEVAKFGVRAHQLDPTIGCYEQSCNGAITKLA